MIYHLVVREAQLLLLLTEHNTSVRRYSILAEGATPQFRDMLAFEAATVLKAVFRTVQTESNQEAPCVGLVTK